MSLFKKIFIVSLSLLIAIAVIGFAFEQTTIIDASKAADSTNISSSGEQPQGEVRETKSPIHMRAQQPIGCPDGGKTQPAIASTETRYTCHSFVAFIDANKGTLSCRVFNVLDLVGPHSQTVVQTQQGYTVDLQHGLPLDSATCEAAQQRLSLLEPNEVPAVGRLRAQRFKLRWACGDSLKRETEMEVAS